MNGLLYSGNYPEDIKKLNDAELEQLSGEIRERLVEIVSKTGGHLASNLGIVELTLALYSFLDPYKDRIIWDVGHQSYVHKILTGRNEQMETIRQLGGLSGFPKTSESDADAFNTGHSSTSVSAALGMCRARDLKGENYNVVAVIGDGSLTGGMALEAINDAGRTNTKLTVIINDNGMSIDQNVGGMSKRLSKIRSRRGYLKAKKGVKSVLAKIPRIGKPLDRAMHKIKESIKSYFVDSKLFEDFGFKHFGPVDGHNIKAMKVVLEQAFETNGPTIIHVVTKKGKGYAPAEENPSAFHGTNPFDKETGKTVTDNTISFSKTFGTKLKYMAEEDKDIVAVTAAMPTGTGLSIFKKEFPERYFDVGIAEQHAVTLCSGMSKGGLKPYVAIYSTFLQRAYDQLLHDAAIQDVPMVIGVDRAGVCGPDGETHQGIYDLSYLNHLPNVTVAAPCCAEELAQMMDISKGVFEKDSKMLKGPFAIRYPAKDAYSFDRDFFKKNPVEYGKGVFMNYAPIVSFDIVIIAIGKMVETAMNSVAELRKRGIRALCFNARFLAPLDDENILQAIEKCGAAITIEDGVKCGGLGSSVAELLASKGIVVPFNMIGLPDETIPHGKIGEIHKIYGMDAMSLSDAAEKLVKAKKKQDAEN